MKALSPRILVVDDDPNICELIQLMLLRSNPDYEIICALTSKEGLELAANQSFDLYALDYSLRGMTGIKVCRTLRQTQSETRIMFFTGESHERERQEAMQAGADAYLVKPNHLENLTETAQRLLGIDNPATTRSVPLNAYRSEATI